VSQSVRLKDIAQYADVSIATVSAVLNNARGTTRVSQACSERIRRAARELGYQPSHAARSLKLGRTKTLGLVLPRLNPNSWDGFSAAVLGATEAAVRSAGFQTLIFHSNDPLELEPFLSSRRVDGVLTALLGVSPALVRVFEAGHIPVVLLHHPPSGNLAAVEIDHALGIRKAVQHLAELNHHRLVWLGPEQGDIAQADLRRQAFEEACEHLKLEHRNVPVNPVTSHPGQMRRAVADLKAFEDPLRWADGAVCYHDLLGLALTHTLHDLGLRVPDDLSVVGFDDIFASLNHPALTTVSHMTAEVAQTGVHYLVNRLNTERAELPAATNPPRITRIEPELIIRDSTSTR
jgi:DNA-binding LacI/PurR family transcriptional regulator